MNKETVYDEQINPLMAKVIEICKQHKIALVADFRLDDEDLHCTTALTTPEFNASDEQKEAVKILYRERPAFAMAITEETKPDGSKHIRMKRIS